MTMADPALIEFELVLPPAIEFCLGVSATVVAPSPVPTPAIGVVIGPKGDEGDAGPPGPAGADGDGATDPGDLTLIFDNHLI